MKDTFDFTLNSPLTEDEWDMITDVDFDRTDRITFHTKHGKEVEFAKVIRCKDCKAYRKEYYGDEYYCNFHFEGIDGEPLIPTPNDYCSWAEPNDFCSRAERRKEE